MFKLVGPSRSGCSQPERLAKRAFESINTVFAEYCLAKTEALIRTKSILFDEGLIQRGTSLYLLAPAEDISEISFGPQFFNVGYPSFSSYESVAADDYDLWVTAVADRSTVLAGPIPEEFLLRENIEIAILDTVDPAIVDVLIYSR